MTTNPNLVDTNGPCPALEQWSAFRVGRLPAETLQSLASHLETCGDCAALLDTLPEPADSLLVDLRQPADRESLSEQEIQRVAGLVERIGGGRTQSRNQESGVRNQESGVPGADSPAASPLAAGEERQLSEGDRIGPYQLLALLGEGGMGQVFKAVDSLMNRTVAVKVISARHVGKEAALARFRREIQALAQLDHPHIVRAYHADQIGDRFYLVMEYVEGITLSELVKQRGPFPVAEACAYIAQVAGALQHAHELGLVHRDIKPHNLILTTLPLGGGSRRVVKVLDFGLAQLWEPDSSGMELTETGQAFGTPEFMSPEQWDDAHAVDIRSDLYSLGCTLYYLLAGKPPFPREQYGKNLRLWKAHAEAPVPGVRELRPDVPEEVEAVLRRLLAKKPADRYATPGELRAALEPFASRTDLPTPEIAPITTGRPVPTQTPRPAEGLPSLLGVAPSRKRRRTVIGLVGGLSVLALVALALGLLSSQHKKTGESPTTAAPVQILSFKVGHYRGDHPKHLGDLGDPSALTTFAVEDDDVKLEVQLSRPAYFYLIAFLPNGKEELRFPKDPNVAPPLQDQLVDPQGETSYFGLTEGVGLEALILFVSAKALPPYAKWKNPDESALWRAKPHPRRQELWEGVWVGDANGIHLVSKENRGEREKLGPPEDVLALYHFYKERPDLAALKVVVFPVIEKK